jgi:hypothetical protein
LSARGGGLTLAVKGGGWSGLGSERGGGPALDCGADVAKVSSGRLPCSMEQGTGRKQVGPVGELI